MQQGEKERRNYHITINILVQEGFPFCGLELWNDLPNKNQIKYSYIFYNWDNILLLKITELIIFLNLLTISSF